MGGDNRGRDTVVDSLIVLCTVGKRVLLLQGLCVFCSKASSVLYKRAGHIAIHNDT